MRPDRYDDEGLDCECGNEKKRQDECCARCAFLDGARWPQVELIEELRIGDMALTELTHATGRDPESVRRTLLLLMESGRVSRYQRELDVTVTTGRCRYGGTQQMAMGGRTCWMYTLVANARAA